MAGRRHSIDLLAKLLRFAVGKPGSPEGEAGLLELSTSGDRVWQRCCAEALDHRVAPLLACVLRSAGHDLRVPAPHRARLADVYRQTLMTNSVLAEGLKRVLARLEEAGVSPIVLKGMVLAGSYYPDLGARPMVDIDLLIRSDETAAVTAAFTSLGYRPHVEWGAGGAVYFRNDVRVSFDVHERFVLFPPAVRASITEERELPALGGRRVLCWEPNAQLVHLVVHLSEHRRAGDTGFLLGWLVDVAFVVRAAGPRLRAARIEELIPGRAERILLWRVLAFLRSVCGLTIPEDLAAAADAHPPLTLPGILRDRRLARWGLPRPRGWGRLVACALGLRVNREGAYPTLGDIAIGLLPGMRE